MRITKKSKKQFQEQIKKLEDIRLAVEKGMESNRSVTQALDSNLRWAISYLQNTTGQGLTDVRNTTKSSLDTLNQNLVLTLRQLQSKQSSDSDKIIAAMLRGMDYLDRSRRQDVQDATRQTVNAINSAKLTNQVAMASLATRMERSQAQTADQTERAINKGTLATQVALSSLALKTVTSLTSLSTDTKRALANLNRDLLAELDWLNRNTTKSLTDLGNKTEAALTNSANRTTRSVDSLSIEVRNLKGSINAVEGAVYQVRGAVNGVEGAVWGSNQNGRLDALIGAISVFGKK